LLFGLDRKAATMATNHATLEAVAQNCLHDMRERSRRRIAALVDMEIDVETALRGEAKYCIEKRIDIVEQPPVNADDSTRHAAENAT
jgi:hypothetical protein